MATNWIRRWGYEMSKKPVRPGIYRLKDGGFFVRARVTDREKRRREVTAVLPNAKAVSEAQAKIDALVADAKAEARGERSAKQTWRSFAVLRLAERIRRGKVESEATIERWKEAIELFDAAWGDVDVREVSRHQIDDWLNTTVADWMASGKTVMRKRRKGDKVERVPITTVIKPSTVNGWLRVLKAISNAAKVKFDLSKSAFDGIEFYEEGRVYTKEQPNSLPPDLLPQFMAIAKAKYPQHYAMILLGMTTGLRPSSLRPLRRKGPEADLDWTTGVLQIRRSHSRGQAVMNKTKTGHDGSIALPKAMMTVLEEHVRSLKGKAADSDLLFPTDAGTLRTRNILAKPFAAIAKEMGLKFRLTPRGMRRTFNDVARAAGIHDAVTRSISGHQTEEMQIHYSTARDAEQRAALERAHSIIEGGKEPT